MDPKRSPEELRSLITSARAVVSSWRAPKTTDPGEFDQCVDDLDACLEPERAARVQEFGDRTVPDDEAGPTGPGPTSAADEHPAPVPRPPGIMGQLADTMRAAGLDPNKDIRDRLRPDTLDAGLAELRDCPVIAAEPDCAGSLSPPDLVTAWLEPKLVDQILGVLSRHYESTGCEVDLCEPFAQAIHAAEVTRDHAATSAGVGSDSSGARPAQDEGPQPAADCPECRHHICHDCGCCACDRSDKGHGCKSGGCPCFGPIGSWGCPGCQARNQHPDAVCRQCGGRATFQVFSDQDAGVDRVVGRKMIEFEPDNSAGVGSDSREAVKTQVKRPLITDVDTTIGGIINPPDVLSAAQAAIHQWDRGSHVTFSAMCDLDAAVKAAAEPAGDCKYVPPEPLSGGSDTTCKCPRDDEFMYHVHDCEKRRRPAGSAAGPYTGPLPTVEVEIEGICKVRRDGTVPPDCRDAIAAAEPAGETGHTADCCCRGFSVTNCDCGYSAAIAAAEPAGICNPPDDGTDDLCRELYGRNAEPRDYLGGSKAEMLYAAAARIRHLRSETAAEPAGCPVGGSACPGCEFCQTGTAAAEPAKQWNPPHGPHSLKCWFCDALLSSTDDGIVCEHCGATYYTETAEARSPKPEAAAEPAGEGELRNAECGMRNPPDVIQRVLERPEFRGLWHSRTIHQDGKIETGWSVTFTRDGDYCEVPYQATAAEACRQALDRLDAAEPAEPMLPPDKPGAATHEECMDAMAAAGRSVRSQILEVMDETEAAMAADGVLADNSAGVGSDSTVEPRPQDERPQPPAACTPIGGIKNLDVVWEYVQHKQECNIVGYIPDTPCTCGLDAVMKAAEPAGVDVPPDMSWECLTFRLHRALESIALNLAGHQRFNPRQAQFKLSVCKDVADQALAAEPAGGGR